MLQSKASQGQMGEQPVNRSALGNDTGNNPSGRNGPAAANSSMFNSGLQSAFAASASTLPMDFEPTYNSMLDMPEVMRSGSRAMRSLSNTVSLDQLLPAMEGPFGASFNDFLLGEAC